MSRKYAINKYDDTSLIVLHKNVAMYYFNFKIRGKWIDFIMKKTAEKYQVQKVVFTKVESVVFCLLYWRPFSK